MELDFQFHEFPKFVLKMAILIFAAQLGFAADTPTKMNHTIIQMSGSGIDANSFSAQPKTFWRASNRYCRVDEEPDPDKGIHGRLVVNEPDAWLVNLADKTAKHMIDRGPTFNCKLPIFAMSQEMATSKVGELEVGHELEFFHANGAKLIDGPKLSFEAKYYELQIGDATLRLAERVDNQSPILIVFARGDKTYKARYLLSEELSFNADLFSKPAGVQVEEVK